MLRVDFSGRAVVIPDPALPLDRCGMPVSMAFELFRLHLAGELVRRGLARDPAAARRLAEARPAFVRPVLDELASIHPVILGVERALSRHGLQAFFPVLTEHRAVSLSPPAIDRLMGGRPRASLKVFLPLGDRAREEVAQRMTSPATLRAPEASAPRIEIPVDARAGLYLASLEGPTSKRPASLHASAAEVARAVEIRAIGLDARVVVRRGSERLHTIAGRCLVLALLPPELPSALADVVLDRKAQARLVAEAAQRIGLPRTARLVEELTALGLALVTRIAPSLGFEDLREPEAKPAILERARARVLAVSGQYDEGLITDGERYQRSIDVWSEARDTLLDAADRRDAAHPLRVAAVVGTGFGRHEAGALASMKGLMAKPSGELHELPITGSLRSGLGAHELFMAAIGVRAGRVRRRQRDRDDDRLARLLMRALGSVRLVARDCGALATLPMRSLADGEARFAGLDARVRGRFDAEGARLEGEALERALAASPREIAVRSTIFCEAEGGVCATCYGAPKLPIGERVGLHAAHALASNLEHLAVRTFHICVCAAAFTEHAFDMDALRAGSPFREAPADGVIAVQPEGDVAVALTDAGKHVVVAPLELFVIDDAGAAISCGLLPPGAEIGAPGSRVKRGAVIASWDQFSRTFVAAHAGTVRWAGLAEGVSVQERVDEVTALSRRMVIDPEGSLAAAIEIEGEDGARTRIVVEHGDVVRALDGAHLARGEVVLTRPIFASTRVPDHLEGWPDLQRILYGGRSDRPALLAEIGGAVSVVEAPDRSRTLTLTTLGPGAEQATRTHRLPRGEYPTVADGDIVAPGELLTHGTPDPGDVARILGPGPAALYLVDQIQLVYAVFGVALDARHVELVVRALLAFVRIAAPGDGPWPRGALALRERFARVVAALATEGRAPPSADLAVTGLWRSDPALLRRLS